MVTVLLSGVLLLLGMLFGARLAYSLSHWVEFSTDPWMVLDVKAGGLSWMGLALGGVIALLIYAGTTDRSPVELLGWHYPLIAVTSIGLWLGAQLAGIGYGPVVPDAWWALPVLDAAGDLTTRIPLPLIGSLLSLFGMMAIDRMVRQDRPPIFQTLIFSAFQFSLIYVMTYFRTDPMVMAGGQSIERWAALIHAGVSLTALMAALIISRQRKVSIASDEPDIHAKSRGKNGVKLDL